MLGIFIMQGVLKMINGTTIMRRYVCKVLFMCTIAILVLTPLPQLAYAGEEQEDAPAILFLLDCSKSVKEHLNIDEYIEGVRSVINLLPSESPYTISFHLFNHQTRSPHRIDFSFEKPETSFIDLHDQIEDALKTEDGEDSSYAKALSQVTDIPKGSMIFYITESSDFVRRETIEKTKRKWNSLNSEEEKDFYYEEIMNTSTSDEDQIYLRALKDNNTHLHFIFISPTNQNDSYYPGPADIAYANYLQNQIDPQGYIWRLTTDVKESVYNKPLAAAICQEFFIYLAAQGYITVLGGQEKDEQSLREYIFTVPKNRGLIAPKLYVVGVGEYEVSGIVQKSFQPISFISSIEIHAQDSNGQAARTHIVPLNRLSPWGIIEGEPLYGSNIQTVTVILYLDNTIDDQPLSVFIVDTNPIFPIDPILLPETNPQLIIKEGFGKWIDWIRDNKLLLIVVLIIFFAVLLIVFNRKRIRKKDKFDNGYEDEKTTALEQEQEDLEQQNAIKWGDDMVMIRLIIRNYRGVKKDLMMPINKNEQDKVDLLQMLRKYAINTKQVRYGDEVLTVCWVEDNKALLLEGNALGYTEELLLRQGEYLDLGPNVVVPEEKEFNDPRHTIRTDSDSVDLTLIHYKPWYDN